MVKVARLRRDWKRSIGDERTACASVQGTQETPQIACKCLESKGGVEQGEVANVDS